VLFLLAREETVMQKKPRIISTLVLFISMAMVQNLASAEQGWLMSIPHALSGEHVYKVRILEIDGKSQAEVFQYPLLPGKHRVKVELMLDVEWEPDLVEGDRPLARKFYEIEVEEGKSYQLAARVDVDAPVEAQLDQSFWEVFVYAVE
jgi:hypothetical protein